MFPPLDLLWPAIGCWVQPAQAALRDKIWKETTFKIMAERINVFIYIFFVVKPNFDIIIIFYLIKTEN